MDEDSCEEVIRRASALAGGVGIISGSDSVNGPLEDRKSDVTISRGISMTSIAGDNASTGEPEASSTTYSSLSRGSGASAGAVRISGSDSSKADVGESFIASLKSASSPSTEEPGKTCLDIRAMQK